MDWLLRIYAEHNGKPFRIKIFPNTLSIEQQPGGPNVILGRDDNELTQAVYDEETKTIDELVMHDLLKGYPFSWGEE
jgi:hypothetical protein